MVGSIQGYKILGVFGRLKQSTGMLDPDHVVYRGMKDKQRFTKGFQIFMNVLF